jgi:hypothetical protein
MTTGYAIVTAGFFLGAAIMFAGADIAQATSHNGGASVFPGIAFLIAGGLALILNYNASQARKNKQD